MGSYSSPVAVANVGGLYGMNVETLSGDKTLVSNTDEIYQYLDEGGANRIITLDTGSASVGDRFVIRHNGSYTDESYLQVKQSSTELDKIYAGAIKEFIFDGANWIAGRIGSGESDTKKRNVTLGALAIAYLRGTAIGYTANARTDGVAVGYGALGYSEGVAMGRDAQGYNRGVALGIYAQTNNKNFSIAIGMKSKCERTGETSININGNDTDQENNVVQGRWEKETANNTPIVLLCGGQTGARFTIRVSSVLAFRMTIVARDNVAGHVAMYTVSDGLIKRDAAGNTTLVNLTLVTVFEDDAAWDVAITADDGNDALQILVTGDDTNPTQWAAVLDGVETHF